MVKTKSVDEFLVSFLVDARGGYMHAQRMPKMKIFVPPDAAPAPTRIICHLLRPDCVAKLPGMNDCDGFASRILQIHSSCTQFQKPILIEMPYIASLRKKNRNLVILKKSSDMEAWKEYTNPTTLSEEKLKEEFGHIYESITPLNELESNRICRIITSDIPNYFSLISRFHRDNNIIGSDGGSIESKMDERVKLTFPKGALLKNIQISLEIQNVDPEIINYVTEDNHNISVSPIVTVEPKRRKFRDLIEIQMGYPKGTTKNDLQNLKVLFSISEFITNWEDVTDSTELTMIGNNISLSTKVSARVWVIFAPGIVNMAELANRIYAYHCPTPYIGKFLAFARRHEEEECQIRCLLITDDNSCKTLECQEGFELIATGPETEIINKVEYQIETAGNIVAVTKSDEAILFPVQSFIENRITLPIRIRNTYEPFCGKIAFTQNLKLVNKQLIKPQTTLDIKVPEFIVDMVGSYRQPDRKHRVKNLSLDRTKGFNAIAKTELNLKTIADKIGVDWLNLSEHLGLNSDDISLVLNENCTNEEKSFMTLIQWQNIFGDKATGNELNRALRSIGREDVIKSCMDNITLVEDEEEAKSAKKQIDGQEMNNHDSFLEDFLANHNKPVGYNESVNESMIVETGDDWSHREENLSEGSDSQSLVLEPRERDSDSNIIPIIDQTRLANVVEISPSKKIEAFHLLIDKLDEILPEPILHDSYPIIYDSPLVQNEEETCLKTEKLMSSVPLDFDFSPNDNEVISAKFIYPVSQERQFEPALQFRNDVHSENVKEVVPLKEKYQIETSFEIHESDPQTQTEVEEETEILSDGSIIKRKKIIRSFSQTKSLKTTQNINPVEERKTNFDNLSEESEILDTTKSKIPSSCITENYSESHSFILPELIESLTEQKRDEMVLSSEIHKVYESDPQTQTEIKEETETLPDGSIVQSKTIRSISHTKKMITTENVDSYEEHPEISLDSPTTELQSSFIKSQDLMYQSIKPSELMESLTKQVYESDPQTQTEIKEETETLPDGSIVQSKTIRSISHTKKMITTENVDSYEDHPEICLDSPTSELQSSFIKSQDLMYQSIKPSELMESLTKQVYESDPQTQTEIEEETETLPDGSIVQSKTIRSISHTKKMITTENVDSYEEHPEISLDSPTSTSEIQSSFIKSQNLMYQSIKPSDLMESLTEQEKNETETNYEIYDVSESDPQFQTEFQEETETLPDGSIVHKKTFRSISHTKTQNIDPGENHTTNIIHDPTEEIETVTTETSTSFITEQDFEGNSVVTPEPNEPEQISAKPTVKARKNKNRKKSNKNSKK